MVSSDLTSPMTSSTSALIAAPAERDAVAAAGLHVAVDAVVGDVELAAHEPLGVGWVGPVEHLVPLLLPFERLGLLGPEALVVAVGLLVDRLVRDQRLLAEVLRRREALDVQHLLEITLEGPLLGAHSPPLGPSSPLQRLHRKHGTPERRV